MPLCVGPCRPVPLLAANDAAVRSRRGWRVRRVVDRPRDSEWVESSGYGYGRLSTP